MLCCLGDGMTGCTLIQGFTIWKSFDYGLYFQAESEVQVQEIISIENQVSYQNS